MCQTLHAIESRIAVCARCPLCAHRDRTVPGEGSPQSGIVFVGEAPGQVNNTCGRPFVGHGGKIFDTILYHLGIARETIFVTNVVKCWPPENRKPKKDEIAACKPYLDEQLDCLKPRVVVALGKTAFETLTGQTITMKVEHGKVVRVRSYTVCATYHPNGIRYVKGGMKTILDDIRMALGGA